MAIDSINYKQYHKCIEYETGQNLKLEGGSVYLNDSIVNEYRFLHDYYFMQGDHTSDSYDSRFGDYCLMILFWELDNSFGSRKM